jgi:hypothetical protein
MLSIIQPVAVIVGGLPAFINGNTLLAMCDRSACMIYIDGVADEWRFVNFLSDPDKPICAADVTGTRLRDAVVSYLKGHPENRNDPAAALITKGIMEAWHCEGDAQPWTL